MKAKEKDPAFLFYSKDFYEGTRMMLPEERACYVDLMIFQHQNEGFIPLDLRRVMMYCSGISEEVLKRVLSEKFVKCEKGYCNQKLSKIVSERESYSKKQTENGMVGNFYKHAKNALNVSEYKNLRKFIEDNYTKESLIEIIKSKETSEATLVAVRLAMRTHLEDAIEIEDVNENKEEGVNEVNLPWDSENFKKSWTEWKSYKRKEYGFKFKSPETEQRALIGLNTKAQGVEHIAIAIINQSIENGWKGFFDLKGNADTKIRTKGTGANITSGGIFAVMERKGYDTSKTKPCD